MSTFTIVIGVFCLLFLSASSFSIWSQWKMFTKWQPVSASVLDQRIERESNILEDSGLKSVLGEAAIEGLQEVADLKARDDNVTHADLLVKNVRKIFYTYNFEGRRYTSSTGYSDQSVADDDLFNRFPVGRTVTAYVNPSNPTRSYVIGKPRFYGYAMALFSIWLLSFLCFVQWDAVASTGLAAFSRGWLPMVVGWWLIGLIAVAHYGSLRGEFSLFAAISAAVYFTFASAPYLIPLMKHQVLPWALSRFGDLMPNVVVTESVAINIAAGVAIVGLSLVLVLPLWSGASMAWQAYRFKNIFEPVKGTVVVSEIRKEGRGGGENKAFYMFYWPEIQFEYSVEGEHYDTGVYIPSNSSIGASGGPNDTMHELLDKHPVGSIHEARYDPKTPAAAFLTTEPASEFVKGTIKTYAFIILLPIVVWFSVVFIGLLRR